MLTMKRMLDESKEKQTLLKELGITTPEVMIYGAYENGVRTGYAIFEWIEGRVVVTHLSFGGDIDLLDGLIRSGMAWFDDNGITSLTFSDKLPKEPLKELWFVSDDTNSVDSIGDFLRTCKKCKM